MKDSSGQSCCVGWAVRRECRAEQSQETTPPRWRHKGTRELLGDAASPHRLKGQVRLWEGGEDRLDGQHRGLRDREF